MRPHSVSHIWTYFLNLISLLFLTSGGLSNCTELAALNPGDAKCGSSQNICCSHQDDQDGAPSNSTGFNCYDGDPTSDESDAESEGGVSKYYGYQRDGKAVSGFPYMCIEDNLGESSTTSNWLDPTSRIDGVIVGATGGAPLCPSTIRRRMEKTMEERYVYPLETSASNLEAAPEESTVAEDDETPPCRTDARENIRELSADKCNPLASAKRSPFQIISRDGKTVTFAFSQVWKQCDGGESANRMNWIALDFVVPENGELECSRTSKPDCGIVNAFTAKCTEGLALIDIYGVDETATGIFYQTDESALTIPDACASGEKKGDTKKACKFRYVLNCLENCEDNKDSSSWWPIDLWTKMTEAFREVASS